MSIGKLVLWKQGWHSEMIAVGMDRLTEKVKGVSVLHATGLPNGKQERSENLSIDTTCAIARFSGLNTGTKRSFCEVIGWFNPFMGNKDKEVLPLPIFMRTSFSGVVGRIERQPAMVHAGCFPKKCASPEEAVEPER